MDQVQKVIRDLVSKEGIVFVAHLLGETTTRNIENWIKPDKSIPKDKIGLIKRVLKFNGYINE